MFWRLFAIFGGRICQKSQIYWQKSGRHFMACSRQRFSEFFWSKSSPSRIGCHQNQSQAAVLAHVLSDPRLPAGPPNAVKRSRRKYHSVVTLSGYSVVKVPPTCLGISKAGCTDRRVLSESLGSILLDGCPGSFEHPLPYASGFRSLLLR